MTILYLITQSNWGGAQKYVLDLAKNVQKELDVTVACGGNGRLLKELRKCRVRTVVFPMLIRAINPIADIVCFFQLWLFLRKNKFDVIHINSTKAEILGIIAARLAKVPKIVFTAHGFVFNEPMPAWKKRFYIGIERFVHRWSHNIIAVSEFDRKTAIDNGIAPAEKITVIYNGIDGSRVKPGMTKNDKKNGQNIRNLITIGSVANFYKTKGLEYLIRAVPLILERYPESRFSLVGDGPERKNIEKIIKELNIGGAIELTGEKENAAEAISEFDIFILPSVKEGFPYVILEAMSAGIPIIASEVGGIPEILKNVGALIPPKNPEAIAEAVCYLIENPHVAALMAANAGKKIRDLNLDKMLEKTKKIYNIIPPASI